MRELEKEGKSVVWDTYDLYHKNGWLLRNVKKGIKVVGFAVFHFEWLLDCIYFLTRNISKRKDIWHPLFNGIFLESLLSAAKTDDRIYIFDEGALQYLWAVKLRGEAGVSVRDLNDIERLLGLPDVLIVVEADAGTIAWRILNRGRKTRIMEEEDLEQAIKKMQMVQKEIVEKVGNKVNVLVCDNSKNSDK